MNADSIRPYRWDEYYNRGDKINHLASIAEEQAKQHNQLRADLDQLLARLGLEIFEGREIRAREAGA